jgi:hypothetical protein
VIYCHADLFHGWRERLKRSANLCDAVWDCGALNPQGDSAATDGPATIARARDVFDRGWERLQDEAHRLACTGAAAVLCDAPALPLVAAQRAGIHGYLLANFTWAEIYEPHAQQLGLDALQFVERLREAYRCATAVFRAEPALPMQEIGAQIPVGLVAETGQNRREELERILGISSEDKLVYFYVGRYGQADLCWERLRTMARVHFVGFHHAPGHELRSFHVVPASSWNGADLAASCDAMVAKAGYGTVCEAMASGTPMIYPRREGFAEHRALADALQAWGGGVPASAQQFAQLELEALLWRAFSLRPGPARFDRDGATTVANYLANICRHGSRSAPLR